MLPLRNLTLLVTLLLPGCMSMQIPDMSAAQIKATNGLMMCAQVVSMYGKGSSITVNSDDIRKGSTAKGKTSIVCGDASMTIEHTTGVAPETH